jgi:hypothetical protein
VQGQEAKAGDVVEVPVREDDIDRRHAVEQLGL